MVYGTQYGDWGDTVTFRGLDARIINLCPWLQRIRTRPSLWNSVKRDLLLKKQCLQCLRSHLLCVLPHTRRRRLWSNINPGNLPGRPDRRPIARSMFTMIRPDNLLPNRLIISSPRRGPRWNDCACPFGSTVGIFGLWADSSELHASPSVADQCLGCFAKFCCRILATHPTFLPLLAKNVSKPTLLQYTTVFALATYAASWPQRMIENAKWFLKKHTQY